MTESGLTNYYRERFVLLVYPTVFINAYYSVFLVLTWSKPLFSEQPPQLLLSLTSQLMVLVLMLIAVYMGVAYPAGRQGSLLLLSLSTFLFILSTSLPVYFWGGISYSIFTSILLVVCVLTIIVIQSQKIRAIFAGISIALLLGLSNSYFEVPTLNPTFVMFGERSYQIASLFHTFSLLIGILITLYVAWANTRLLHGDDNLSNSPR
jgi:hypothetical protein